MTVIIKGALIIAAYIIIGMFCAVVMRIFIDDVLEDDPIVVFLSMFWPLALLVSIFMLLFNEIPKKVARRIKKETNHKQ